jgi:hypothetical protein
MGKTLNRRGGLVKEGVPDKPVFFGINLCDNIDFFSRSDIVIYMKKIIALLVIVVSVAANSFAEEPFYVPAATAADISLFALTQDPYKAETNRWPAFFVNLFPGFGIGSYIQGDLVGGIIGTVGESIGAGVLAGGIIIAGGFDISSGGPGPIMTIAGGALFIGTKIFSLIKPFTYSNKLNFGMAPALSPDGKIGLTAAVGFTF